MNNQTKALRLKSLCDFYNIPAEIEYDNTQTPVNFRATMGNTTWFSYDPKTNEFNIERLRSEQQQCIKTTRLMPMDITGFVQTIKYIIPEAKIWHLIGQTDFIKDQFHAGDYKNGKLSEAEEYALAIKVDELSRCYHTFTHGTIPTTGKQTAQLAELMRIGLTYLLNADKSMVPTIINMMTDVFRQTCPNMADMPVLTFLLPLQEAYATRNTWLNHRHINEQAIQFASCLMDIQEMLLQQIANDMQPLILGKTTLLSRYSPSIITRAIAYILRNAAEQSHSDYLNMQCVIPDIMRWANNQPELTQQEKLLARKAKLKPLNQHSKVLIDLAEIWLNTRYAEN